jgi:hypothetical protein
MKKSALLSDAISMAFCVAVLLVLWLFQMSFTIKKIEIEVSFPVDLCARKQFDMLI